MTRFIVVPRRTSEHYNFNYMVVHCLTTDACGSVWCETDSKPAAEHIAEALERFPPMETKPEEPF